MSDWLGLNPFRVKKFMFPNIYTFFDELFLFKFFFQCYQWWKIEKKQQLIFTLKTTNSVNTYKYEDAGRESMLKKVKKSFLLQRDQATCDWNKK